VIYLKLLLTQSLKWKFEFTDQSQILEFIFIYNVVLNENWKFDWFEQSFTGLGPEDRCSSWGLWTDHYSTTIVFQYLFELNYFLIHSLCPNLIVFRKKRYWRMKTIAWPHTAYEHVRFKLKQRFVTHTSGVSVRHSNIWRPLCILPCT
jgi:hypothetical protein